MREPKGRATVEIDLSDSPGWRHAALLTVLVTLACFNGGIVLLLQSWHRRNRGRGWARKIRSIFDRLSLGGLPADLVGPSSVSLLVDAACIGVFLIYAVAVVMALLAWSG